MFGNLQTYILPYWIETLNMTLTWRLFERTYYSLDENYFTGSIPFEVGNLGKLRKLNLCMSHEKLFAIDSRYAFCAPHDYRPFLKSFSWLDVVKNSLGGSIPGEIGRLFQLNELVLGMSSKICGTIFCMYIYAFFITRRSKLPNWWNTLITWISDTIVLSDFWWVLF